MIHSRLRPLAATLLAAATAGLAAAPGASADAGDCSRYAAPAGSDTAAGTAAAPFRTAQRLASSLDPGDTGCLREGTYSDEVDGPYVIRFNRGGAAGRPITVRSAPGEHATLRGIVFVPHDSDHVTLSDLTVDGRRPVAAPQPVSLQVMAADTVLEDLDVSNASTRSCLILGSGSGWGRAERTVVRRNVFHDCGDPANRMLDHAIYAEAVDGAQITDNLMLRSGGFAIQLYPQAKDTLVAHNVMADNGGGVIFAGSGGLASAGNVVEQNVIAGSKLRPGLQSYWDQTVGTGNVARSNCTLNPAKGEVDDEAGGYTLTGNVTTDPGFHAAGRDDYRLSSNRCLATVGYDTAAKLHDSPTAAPDSPTASPAPTPASSEPAGSGSELGGAFVRTGRKARKRARRERAARARSVRARSARQARISTTRSR